MKKTSMITRMVQEEFNYMMNEIDSSKNKFSFGVRFIMSQTNPRRYFDFLNYKTFTTQYDTDIINYDIIVNWSAYFKLNQAGFENFIIDVEGVKGLFTVEMRDLHSDEVVSEEEKNIEDFDWKYIVDDANLTKGSSLYIHHLTFDFKQKSCTVVFTN